MLNQDHMRTGNPTDGMYLFLLLIPIMTGILAGGYFKRKIISHLLLETSCSHISSGFAANVVQFLTIVSGFLLGFLLVRIA